MLRTTNGILLRAVKYGETSLILTVYTELQGVQSCMVQGVRKNVKGGVASSQYQIGSQLQYVLYWTPTQQMHRVKEVSSVKQYNSINNSVPKYAVVTMMMELLLHTLHEPEPHPEIYQLTTQLLEQLDSANEKEIKWMPHYFLLHLAAHLGFAIHTESYASNYVLQLSTGTFMPVVNEAAACCTAGVSSTINALALLNAQQLPHAKLEINTKRDVLQDLLLYYKLHIPNMPALRSVAVLEAVFA